MKKIATIVLGTTLIISGMFLATGCERQEPAEQAGKDVKATVEQKEEMVNPPGSAEKAGKDVDQAVTDQTK